MDKAESQRITNVFDLYQEMLELLETAKNELDNTGEEQIKNMIDKVRHILLNFWTHEVSIHYPTLYFQLQFY